MTATAATPAGEVLRAILMRDYRLYRTAQGEPFAVHCRVPCVMIRFRGNGGLRQRLAADMYAQTGRTATSNALSDVLNMAEGICSQGISAVPALRIAARGESLYLDLGRTDGLAVQLYPGGWRLLHDPPAMFSRTAMTDELPVPVPGGSLDGVRDLINIRGESEWALYCACRVASLFPGITHPVELMTGPPGSAKTSTTRWTSEWVDPSPAMVPVPRDGRTWAAIAGSSYVLPVDNVSWVPAWWSDLLCKAASGDGWIDRALYTDGDVYVSAFQSVIILNGITLGALRGDLADRICGHVLAPPAAYRSDDELNSRWRAAHPQALGWLLDRAAEVMTDIGRMPAPQTASRLSRFSQIVQCVDWRWGTRAMDAWLRGRADVLEDVAEGDEVAVALMAAVKAPVSVTSTELLALLRYQGGLADGRSRWTPKSLGEHIERAAGALGALGWQVTRYREGEAGARKWMIIPPQAANGHLDSPALR